MEMRYSWLDLETASRSTHHALYFAFYRQIRNEAIYQTHACLLYFVPRASNNSKYLPLKQHAHMFGHYTDQKRAWRKGWEAKCLHNGAEQHASEVPLSLSQTEVLHAACCSCTAQPAHWGTGILRDPNALVQELVCSIRSHDYWMGAKNRGGPFTYLF